SVDAQLQQLVHDKYPDANFTVFMVREWKEKWGFVGDAPKDPIVVTVPVAGVPTSIDITDEMRTACESLVPPIVETTYALLAEVEPEFQERVRRNITLAGGGALIRNLGPKLQCALEKVGGGHVNVVEDPTFVGADGCLAIARDAPNADWDKLGR
ncbi:MAG TPA: rod shape-determining protein, partial [Vicinamibacterales bacterium]|nr:rod shape-determining protein [Vicinamibacterales bacterium]